MININDAFVARMAQEIEHNTPLKGDWVAWNPTRAEIISELDKHCRQLRAALSVEHVNSTREFAADVANIAMKAFELFG